MARTPDDPDAQVPESSARPRAAGRAAGLRLEEIRDRAMALIAELGIERFSMRRLAADLGVTPMSLYHHVRNKDELTLLLQQGIIEMLDVADPSLPWDERLRRTLRHAIDVARTYPQLARFSIEHPEFLSLHDPFFEDITDAVRAGGMPEDRLDETMTWVISFFAGIVMMEGTSFHDKIDPETEPDSDLGVELIISSVRTQLERYRADES